ncbi:hypothetical protein BU23DRAFT_562045 [Bimuria novae-zelandiae CBS 107.79]|uniref:Uncharacterized protein n=1 Tax=Bimuria novae-zelandiae CBS 107.79 TaxID=1447943 RepID=A0A6A5UHG9_9PLEO|nr:hypothetical protein BU23DRAFT_562045 [Bimuria novae-zelandiae CBS 107.79]
MSCGYSLYVMLVTNEVYHVHQFLQRSYDLHSIEDRARRRQDCIGVDQGLQDWRARFEAVQVQIQVGGGEEPNSTLIHCALDLATISLYQPLIFPSQDATPGTWNHAVRRCLDAADGITHSLQLLPPSNLQNISPLIIPCVFVAARFCLVHARLFKTGGAHNLDVLAEKLKACALRWPYAKRLEKVLSAAMAGEECGEGLPVQFWDLRYSYLDVDEALRAWEEGGGEELGQELVSTAAEVVDGLDAENGSTMMRVV